MAAGGGVLDVTGILFSRLPVEPHRPSIVSKDRDPWLATASLRPNHKGRVYTIRRTLFDTKVERTTVTNHVIVTKEAVCYSPYHKPPRN